MTLKIEHDSNAVAPLSRAEREAAERGPVKAPRKRKLSRPTTPELEALYFQTAVYLTKRETALFMWAMGRSTEGGAALANLFLNPEVTT